MPETRGYSLAALNPNRLPASLEYFELILKENFHTKSRLLVKKHALWQKASSHRGHNAGANRHSAALRLVLVPSCRHTCPHHLPVIEGTGVHSLHLNVLILVAGKLVTKSLFPTSPHRTCVRAWGLEGNVLCCHHWLLLRNLRQMSSFSKLVLLPSLTDKGCRTSTLLSTPDPCQFRI